MEKVRIDRRWLPLNALRAFEGVARYGSFTGAASALSIAQSALSRHVISLENLIGVKLFERRPHSLVLTAAGEHLLPVVSRAFDRLEHAIDEIRDPHWIDVHLLRARASGDHIYVDFHLTVPADWTIHHAHESIERLEQHILMRLERPGAVLIHLDYPHLPGQSEPLATADLRPVPLTVDLAIRAKHPEERPN